MHQGKRWPADYEPFDRVVEAGVQIRAGEEPPALKETPVPDVGLPVQASDGGRAGLGHVPGLVTGR